MHRRHTLPQAVEPNLIAFWQTLDGPDEAVTSARYIFDEVGLARGVTQRSTQAIHGIINAVIEVYV